MRATMTAEAKRHGKKGKLNSEEEEQLQTGMTQAASLFVNPKAVYRFRLVDNYSLNFDAGGALNAYLTWDPAVFAEHTAYLVYMFQEVRIVHSRLTLVPRARVPAADGSMTCVVVSSTMKVKGTNPTGYGDVQDEANSRLLSSNINQSVPFSYAMEVPKDFLFASVSTPAPAINQGGYGQWWLSAVNLGLPSTPAFTAMVENVYEYRSRD